VIKRYLNKNLKVPNIPLNDINTMFHEFFHRKDYEWYYAPQPGDVCVDVGACVGFFTCLALDGGARSVYAIEPNREHLKTLLDNTSDYFIDHGETPVVPINVAIGSKEEHYENIFGPSAKFQLMSFKDCMTQYDIEWIDYLKIDCEGGEYDIFSLENVEFLRNNVQHIAVEFHLDSFPEAPSRWLYVRNNILKHFDENKIRFLEHDDRELAFDDLALRRKNWEEGRSFMMYITNTIDWDPTSL